MGGGSPLTLSANTAPLTLSANTAPLTLSANTAPTLHTRWLGRVGYTDALALQRQLNSGSTEDYLLLLEHPHVVTTTKRTSVEHILCDVEALGATIVETDRGGDVTYHGPGQLVGYPILSVAGKRSGGMADTAAYVRSIEQLLIDVLAGLGLDVGRLDRSTGVWVEPDGPRPRKIAAIGVRLSRGRSMHGFALNIDPDLTWFDRIVPCGIPDKGVTSVAAEGIEISMREVVDLVADRAALEWMPYGHIDRADVAWRVRASVPVQLTSRKPEWMRVPLDRGRGYREIKKTMRDLDLVTVCEEAGCPNISECWNDGTATFMILGDRCTRACGFCLIDTSKPLPVDADEPERVAAAVDQMGLKHAVVTMVARDDLADGGAAVVKATVEAIRYRVPTSRVEVLVSDFRGDDASLRTVFAARPDVFNHNIETVARLQRAARPSASYARSLSVLARAKAAGLITKSSIIVGMGETADEVVQTLVDLHAVGVDIVTIGQYLQPTARHLPVANWWPPSAFAEWKVAGEDMGISHVESSPLTRSSYHAREAADAAERV